MNESTKKFVKILNELHPFLFPNVFVIKAEDDMEICHEN